MENKCFNCGVIVNLELACKLSDKVHCMPCTISELKFNDLGERKKYQSDKRRRNTRSNW